MAEFITNKIKDFNAPQVEAELSGVSGFPTFTLSFRGFIAKDRFDRVTPFPEASRVLGRTEIEGTVTIDTALRGDIQVTTRNPLTGPQQTELDTILTAHSDLVDTARQGRDKQAETDQATLRTSFDAGIADSDLSITAKLTLRELGEDV